MSSPRYVGESTFLRLWPPGMLAFGFVVLTMAGRGAVPYAVLFAACAVISARTLPWRYVVVDEGIVLWFPFGRRRFLPRGDVTIRVGEGSAVARPDWMRRFGYPLSDGLLERRLTFLRAVLVEHGFRLA